ncbi:MAG: hypothetical protein F2667_09255 [Actinobacteria bacterium]|uniref:Unannotated protein n=1 Tax=freshwater metagenome TaxID=449393 RepID=A0A6J6R2F6_9ZZZZ|nr:hypothetical protein [Actinomycetota bacterium]
MISLTRLSGSVFALNSDLIERIDSTPDTIITLVDGSKYVVAESMSTVIAVIRAHRAEVVALSSYVQVSPEDFISTDRPRTAVRPTLSVVTPPPSSPGPTSPESTRHDPAGPDLPQSGLAARLLSTEVPTRAHPAGPQAAAYSGPHSEEQH